MIIPANPITRRVVSVIVVGVIATFVLVIAPVGVTPMPVIGAEINVRLAPVFIPMALIAVVLAVIPSPFALPIVIPVMAPVAMIAAMIVPIPTVVMVAPTAVVVSMVPVASVVMIAIPIISLKTFPVPVVAVAISVAITAVIMVPIAFVLFGFVICQRNRIDQPCEQDGRRKYTCESTSCSHGAGPLKLINDNAFALRFIIDDLNFPLQLRL